MIEPSPEASVERLATMLRDRLPDVLVALDFDGTLAPIVADPMTSRPVTGVVEAMGELARRGAHVAVVTGRDAATAVRLGGFERLPGLTVLGLYGAERWHAGALSTPDTPAAMQALRRELPPLVERYATDPRVWVEDKRLSLVVHGRLAHDPDTALDPVAGPVAGLADRLGLEVHPGKQVLEVRLPGYDKGGALASLIDPARPAAVLYVGDDVGDVPAFELIHAINDGGEPHVGLARALAVAGADGSVPPDLARLADGTLADPGQVVQLLAAITA